MISSRHPDFRRRQRGFTLIEALCALLLVGIILPVAMRGITLAVQATTTADHIAEATELCRSKLSELSAAVDTSNFTGGGQFPDQPAYTWASTYTTRDDGTDELTCTVSWQQAGGQRSLALTTLVYFPSADSTSSSSSSGGAQ